MHPHRRPLSRVAVTAMFLLIMLTSCGRDKPAGEHLTITVSWANVRTGPDASSQVLSVLPGGTTLRILTSQQGWHRIRLTDGREGWVAGSIVQITPVVQGATSSAGLHTALLNAANQGNANAVRTLLAQGAEINAVSSRGETALMLAAYNGHTATVQALLASGATVQAADAQGWTPLILATRQGHADLVRLLQRYGARH